MDISFFVAAVFLATAWLTLALTFDEPLLYGLSGILFILIGSQTLTTDVTIVKVLVNNTTSTITHVQAASTQYYGLIFIVLGATLLITTAYRHGRR